MNSTEKWRAYYSPVGRIRMLAGHPALDMANTLHWRDDKLLDFVGSYQSLVDWAEVAGLLSEGEHAGLLRKVPKHADLAASIHQQWLELRTRLKAWLPSINGREQTVWRGQQQVSGAHELSQMIGGLAGTASLGVYYGMDGTGDDSQSLALPLLRSTTAIWNLMNFPPAGFVRECEADSCGGYFIDQSRSKPRRWCSMDSCGNRAKAQRFRHTLGRH